MTTSINLMRTEKDWKQTHKHNQNTCSLATKTNDADEAVAKEIDAEGAAAEAVEVGAEVDII